MTNIAPNSRFGKLVVVGPGETLISGKYKRARLKCLCDCGNTAHVEPHCLKNGNTSTCGCSKRKLDIKVGDKFTRLTVIVVPNYGESNKVTCFCECGNTTDLEPAVLISKKTKSCGCLKTKRGSDSTSTEYKSWYAMIRRCYEPNDEYFESYGARGITVCAEWRESYQQFLADMGRKPTPLHTIDRENNNGNYEPNNCRWATPKQQANNRRSSRLIAFNGQNKTLSQWADSTGLAASCLTTRLNNGWSIENALTTPSGAT